MNFTNSCISKAILCFHHAGQVVGIMGILTFTMEHNLIIAINVTKAGENEFLCFLLGTGSIIFTVQKLKCGICM